jgi:ribosome-binding ATPase YchF (GTP1/OBG family)
MDLLPVEIVPKELQLSDHEIMKNRCELIESQLKFLQKMVDDTQTENQALKKLVEELYCIVEGFSTDEETDDETEEEESVAVPVEALNASVGSLSLETNE